MPLTVFGISHHTAPLDLRERVAVPRGLGGATAAMLRDRAGLDEAAVLSTCNRTEVYGQGPRVEPGLVVQLLGELRRQDVTGVDAHLYVHEDEAAVRHLFRVACGMDSLVLGEPQILGQVKQAWQEACSAGAVGRVLDRLFQRAFAAAKQVRHTSGIGDHPVSVAYTATVLARQIFGDLQRQSVLLIGAGEMIERCARHFRQQGVAGLRIANRSLDRAEALAREHGAEACALERLDSVLADADIVVSSTASARPVLLPDSVAAAMKARRRRPMFIVDIAVPRDVHPGVAELDDVYLYTIDDLQQVVDDNLGARQRAAQSAGTDIEQATAEFMRWLHGSRAAHSLKTVRRRAQQDAEELARRSL
ncbi:MAG: glutamyl-tRNA reductase, partial [Xanthomonadales bacterium]|nr:glutamyl-tRNA reductase [Xanthomonadales bacterium]